MLRNLVVCTVFRHNKKRVPTRFTLNSLPLRQVTECTYLGVVLSDDLSCTKDVERAKLAFFEQFNSLYQKFSFANKDVLIHLFKHLVMTISGRRFGRLNSMSEM